MDPRPPEPPAPPARPECPGCGASVGPDDNFCSACNTALNPVWVCWNCSAANEASAASCAGCGEPRDTPLLRRLQRRRTMAGLVLLAVLAAALGAMVVSDIIRGRHALSTKDGAFQRAVQGGHFDR